VGPLVAGLDLGGTKVLGVALGAGEVVAEARVPTPRGDTAIVDALIDVVARLEDATGAPMSAIGVGIAGLVDRGGVLRFGPNVPGVVDLDVRGRLNAAVGRPVVVDNDATCALWAEHLVGAAVGATDVVFVALGTGIGGAVVAGGALQRGAHGFAGEFGHMMVDPSGPPCPCGGRGCWERFASGARLRRIGREAARSGRGVRILELAGGSPDQVRGEHVTAAAREGDAVALGLVDELAWWVAVGVAGLVNALDPEVVVLGGGLSAEADLLLDPVRAAYATLVLGVAHRPAVPIRAAALGARAGAVGAALLAGGTGERVPTGTVR